MRGAGPVPVGALCVSGTYADDGLLALPVDDGRTGGGARRRIRPAPSTGLVVAFGGRLRPRRPDQRPAGFCSDRAADGGVCPAGSANRVHVPLALGNLPGRSRRRGRAVVRGDRRGRTGLCRVVLLAAQRRPLCGPLRSRRTGLVPSAAAVARDVAVDVAPARLPAVPLSTIRACRGQAAARPWFLWPGRHVVAIILLRRRLQAGHLHSAGPAAARPGSGLLPQRLDPPRGSSHLLDPLVAPRFPAGVPRRIGGPAARRRSGPDGVALSPHRTSHGVRPGRRLRGRRRACWSGSAATPLGRSAPARPSPPCLRGC